MHRKKYDAVFKSVASLFQILSNPDRVRLLSLLKSKEMGVTELHETLELSQSSVSQHLKLLKMHHLVEERREGRHSYYHLKIPDVLNVITEAIAIQTKEHTMEAEALVLLEEMHNLL